MRLDLFHKIDQTLALYQENVSLYEYHDKKLVSFFRSIASGPHDFLVGINSRVKSAESIKEKIIRSRIYMKMDQPDEILHHMSDVIGLTLECRFMSDEKELLELLREKFLLSDDGTHFYTEENPNIWLNLKASQPQVQKNGYEIYRLDGILWEEEQSIRFEVQIKALVNLFWSNIEHKLVYKNTNYFEYDSFMKEILSSIKDNLQTIDNQLSIVYRQMQHINASETNEENFENLITKSLNDLFALKMSNSIGFSINIKNMSTIISHYIFVKDLKYETSTDRFAILFQTFKRLSNTNIDFESEIQFESYIVPNNNFEAIFGEYLYSVINLDYEWHAFFKMLFFIEPGNNIEDFQLFLKVIQAYLMDHYWFKTSFALYEFEESEHIHHILLTGLAKGIVNVGTIKIIDGKHLQAINHLFYEFVTGLEQSRAGYTQIVESSGEIEQRLIDKIQFYFESNAYL